MSVEAKVRCVKRLSIESEGLPTVNLFASGINEKKFFDAVVGGKSNAPSLD